jgi:hypothetical protein
MENGVASFWTLSTSSADRSDTVNVSPVAAVLRRRCVRASGAPAYSAADPEVTLMVIPLAAVAGR